MNRVNRSLVLVLIVLVAILIYRTIGESETPTKTEPAKVEAIEGSDLKRVILTNKAAERLGIETAAVRWMTVAQRGTRLVVPYSSMLYDLNGKTWVYTNSAPLTFVRQPISVDYIESDIAILSFGPAAGTLVVTVGAAELYGVETGVGK